MARFTAPDWLNLGMRQLAAHGADGLTIDHLCRAASRTRGSFYHHFESHDAFVERMMADWKSRHTIDVINTVDAIDDDLQRPRALSRLALNLDRNEEVAVRRFAQSNNQAALVVDAVDTMRLAYLEKLHRAAGRLSITEARQLAQLEYAAFIGTMVLWPRAPHSVLQGLEEAQAVMTRLFVEAKTRP